MKFSLALLAVLGLLPDGPGANTPHTPPSPAKWPSTKSRGTPRCSPLPRLK